MAMNAGDNTQSDRTRHGADVLAIASGGGHWVQLLRLRPAFTGLNVAYATVERSYRPDVGAAPFYVVNDATRRNPFSLILLAVRIVILLFRVRPRFVVSTGAAPGYLAVRLCWLVGARSIWIDSLANAGQLSLSGDRIGRHADLWLTQWQHLERPHGPYFEGAVL